MIKLKRIIQNNIKLFVAFILGGIIIGGIGTYVYADIVIQGTSVGYTDTNNIGATNVQNAIDKLYELSRTKKQIQAWEYHESGNNKCISGEEDTCKKTTCYQSGSTCSMGTIIKYYVNNNVFHYFYVLRDSGSVITMQQRENTVRNIAWHAGNSDNSKGPDTVLPALEQATSTWTNVNILEYTPGTTTLYQNTYTGCTYSGGSDISGYIPTCGVNTYTSSLLGTRKARARMITLLEASSTGCLVYKDGTTYTNIMGNSINAYNQGSCPDFMHSYLVNSTTYGGSYKNNTMDIMGRYDFGYWTMSAFSNYQDLAWYVSYLGNLVNDVSVSNGHNGARAVVEITK